MYQSFRSAANVDSGLYEKAASGASPDRVLLKAEAGVNMRPLDWSADGNWILYSRQTGREADASANRDLWLLPTTADRRPRPYVASEFDEPQAVFSPDGRFIAYTTKEVSGDYEVVVQPFPDPARGKWKISRDGGCCPRWKRDGAELYYANTQNRIVAVPVRTAPAFEAGRPVPLDVFVGATSLRGALLYDVAPDGRFLLEGTGLGGRDNEEQRSAITVVLDWTKRIQN